MTISNDLRLAEARDGVNSVKTQIQFVEKEIQGRTAEQAQILKETGGYQARLQRLPIREQEMAQITRDYEIAKANYKSLLDKRLAAGMATAMEHREKSERFEVIDAAQVPSKPTSPNRPMLDGAGSVVGLVLGVALALGLQIQRDVVLGGWEIPVGVPVLGSVPVINMRLLGGQDSSPIKGRRRFRLALACSIALSLLMAIAAGAYVMAHRF
jgi:hypothetical protein